MKTDFRSLSREELAQREAPPVREELRVIVSEDAFDRIARRGAAEPGVEVGGVLVGGVFRDSRGAFVLVEDTIDAEHAVGDKVGLTFTHATWDHIGREMDARHPGKRIVGWYHTHPGFGVFLSEADTFIHRSFFDLPFQVALVFDPTSREHGVFAWRDGEPWRLRCYWVGAEPCTWDGPREASGETAVGPDARRDAAKGRDDDASRGRADPADVRCGWGGVAVAVAAVLLAGALGFYLGGRGRTTAPEVQALVLESRAQGAQEAVRQLRTDLLSIVRDVASDEGVRAAMEEARRALANAGASLAAIPASESDSDPTAVAVTAARRGVEDAAEVVARVRDRNARAQAVLRLLEAQAHGGPADVRALEARVGELTAVMGQTWAELAAAAERAGDLDRARRLLAAAARFDRANAARHQKALDALPPPAGGTGTPVTPDPGAVQPEAR